MGVLAWAKIWVANPSFNSGEYCQDRADPGCSMAAVTIFSVVIKEGNVPKLLEILLIVAFGGESTLNPLISLHLQRDLLRCLPYKRHFTTSKFHLPLPDFLFYPP